MNHQVALYRSLGHHSDTMLTVRCVRCDHLFKETAVSFLIRDSELEFRCPSCGTHCFPGDASQVVTVAIPWQHLRFLAVLAMDQAHATEASDDVYHTLREILARLAPYRPAGAFPLTYEELVAEQAQQGNQIVLEDRAPDGSALPRMSPPPSSDG